LKDVLGFDDEHEERIDYLNDTCDCDSSNEEEDCDSYLMTEFNPDSNEIDKLIYRQIFSNRSIDHIKDGNLDTIRN